MRTRRLTLASLIFLSACAPTPPETVFVAPVIPAELLEECPISDRRADTFRQLATLATEHLETAQCANGKLKAIGAALEKVKP